MSTTCIAMADNIIENNNMLTKNGERVSGNAMYILVLYCAPIAKPGPASSDLAIAGLNNNQREISNRQCCYWLL